MIKQTNVWVSRDETGLVTNVVKLITLIDDVVEAGQKDDWVVRSVPGYVGVHTADGQCACCPALV